MAVGLAGGDLRPGIRLYHPREPEGRTFRPVPEEDYLRRLARGGWVDTPRKLPGYQEPEMVPGLGPEADDYTEQTLVTEVAPAPPAPARLVPSVQRQSPALARSGEPSIDIRTIPPDEAVAIIAKITDAAVLKKILTRERGLSKPKGGRRKVLDALADRMSDLLA